MAISATFVARFDNFFDQVNKADAKLGEFAMSAAQTQKGLDRLAASFSGDRIIKDAGLTAKAIEDIGGAAMLTDKEAARVNRTMVEAIEKMQKIGQTVPESWTKLAQETAEAANQTQKYGDRSQAASAHSMTLADRVTAVSQAFDQAKAAILQVGQTLGSWLEASNASEDSAARLSAALESQGNTSTETVSAYLDLASAYQRTTIYSDEMLASAEEVLTTIGGVMPQDMNRALRATTNLAAGLRIDLDAAAKMVSKALDGNTTALQKQGIEVDKSRAKIEGASYVLEVIADRFKNRAAREAETFSGQMKVLDNQIDDTRETLGRMLASGLSPLLTAFQNLSPQMQSAIAASAMVVSAVGAIAVAVVSLTAAFSLAAPALAGFGTALLAVSINPITLAILAGVAAIVALKHALDESIGSMKQAAQTTSDLTLMHEAMHGGLASGKITVEEYRAALERSTKQKYIDQQAARDSLTINAALGASFGGLTINVDEYIARLKMAQNEARTVARAHGEEIKAALDLGVSMEDVAKKHNLSTDAARVYSKVADELEAAQRKAAEASKQHAEAVKKVADAYKTSGLNEQQQILVEGLLSIGDVSKLSAESQKKLAGNVADLMSAFKNLGIDAPKHIKRIYDETQKLVVVPEVIKKALEDADKEARKLGENAQKETEKRLSDMTKRWMSATSDALKAASGVSQQFVEMISTSTERAIAKADEWKREQLRAIEPLKKDIPAVYETARRSIDAIYKTMIQDAQSAASNQVSVWQKSMLQIPDIVTKALQGGGDIKKSLISMFSGNLFDPEDGPIGKMLVKGASSLGLKIGGNIGAKVAGSLANAIPGMGQAFGMLASLAMEKLGPVLGKLFGKVSAEVKQARTDIGAFEEKLAGTLTQAQKIEAGGVGWKQTTIAVRDAYLAVGKTAAEAEAIVKQLWDDKNPARSKAAMEEINKVLEQQKEKFAELKTLQDELASLQEQNKVSFRDMSDVASKFGIDLAGLGPAFNSARMAEKAKEIIDGFETMKRGGADMGTVLHGMSDEISAFVQESLKLGTTVPENMRPMIEELIKNGELLDANGEKITDISQINFGDPVASKFELIAKRMEEVAKKIGELVDVLKVGLVDAAGKAAQGITDHLNSVPKEWNFDVTTRYNDEHNSTDGGYASGTMGVTGSWFKNFGAGTRTTLHGDEAVVRRDQAGAFAAAFGGGEGGVVDELRAMRGDLMALPGHIARATRDAILVAG